MESTQRRQPRGTSAGGQFATRHHREVHNTELSEPEQASDVDAVYARIESDLSARGIEVPPAIDALFDAHRTRSGAVWPADEPDRVPHGDLWSEPGTLTWKGAGFTPAEARAWEEADVLEPSVAKDLSDAGLSATDAGLIYNDRGDGEGETVGRVTCFREITAEQAARFVANARQREALTAP